MQTDLLKAIFDQQPVTGLTHNFYRYPARFSPNFAREIIRNFSNKGDLIYDPFVGGGTSLVEARALGRLSVGTDVNSLAVFVSKVKTTILHAQDISTVHEWASDAISIARLNRSSYTTSDWIEAGYHHNIDTKETWRIKKLIELILDEIEKLPEEEQQNFARCVLLSTAQWALDCRLKIPSVQDFRIVFLDKLDQMIEGAKEFARQSEENPVDSKLRGNGIACFEYSAAKSDKIRILQKRAPKLILTSPPYPGTHVLYHRWQVQGRKETKAGYWIANELDGNFAPFYCMGERKRARNADYFENLEKVFSSIAKIADAETLVVQMLAFPQPEWQLDEYLDVMKKCGFKETRKTKNGDGRLWRAVPGRKFYATEHCHGTNNEVVLFHKLNKKN